MSSSPAGAIPECPYFGSCPGCQWHHLDYSAQITAKTDESIRAVASTGLAKPGVVADCLSCPDEYGYRNCIDFTVGRDKAQRIRLGISREDDSEIIPVSECQLLPHRVAGLPKSIAGVLTYLFGAQNDLAVDRVRIRVSRHRKNLDISLWTHPGVFPRQMAAKTLASATGATGINRVIYRQSLQDRNVAGVENLSGQKHWTERIGGFSFHVMPPSAFTTNTVVAEKMIATAVEITDISQNDRLLEVMPGSFAFAIPMSPSAGRTTILESDRFALGDIRRTAEVAGNPIEIIPGSIEYGFEGAASFDVVIVHSSRTQMSLETWKSIALMRPRLILHHAQELSSLSRDLESLIPLGYTLRRVIPFDTSPHTPQIETLGLFERT